jgi:hypothetical protein
MSEPNKEEIVTTIKQYLNDCELAVGKINKIKVNIDLFQYILKIPHFLSIQAKFRNQVKNKINELLLDINDKTNISVENLNYVNKLNDIFNECITLLNNLKKRSDYIAHESETGEPSDDEIEKTIQQYLNDWQDHTSRINKLKIANILFKYILTIPTYLCKKTKLRHILKEKINQLKYDINNTNNINEKYYVDELNKIFIECDLFFNAIKRRNDYRLYEGEKSCKFVITI